MLSGGQEFFLHKVSQKCDIGGLQEVYLEFLKDIVLFLDVDAWMKKKLKPEALTISPTAELQRYRAILSLKNKLLEMCQAIGCPDMFDPQEMRLLQATI